ncbi:hypothetical protein CDCA_CDCA12G3345 [Cyanidium caldarium]|uniref:Uncharacterized protein n=1 Tax=Cyanidium caldarium TaxID=2771 RepID=A0AAV9IYC6_CYACA|nr:hypothetical protein CDCA_CDCA12G3345 [Cyanidium caldarium]
MEKQFDRLRVKLRGPYHVLDVPVEMVDLSTAAKGKVFADAELKKLFGKHKMSHLYTLLTRTPEKRLMKPADVVATREARSGEATQMAPAATVVLLDIESPPGTEDGKQELSAVPRMPTYTKYELWRMLLLDGHDASLVWGCRKLLLLLAFRKRLISEDASLFNLLGRVPPATSGGGEVRATTEPQSSPSSSPEGMFHANAQLRELLAQVGERCGPNADEDLMLLRALECDLVMWEDLMVEPPPQVPKVQPPAEGEPFTTASLRQLLRDHDIPFHPNMSCKRLANLAKLKGIATGSQLETRKPEPERRSDPTHLEKRMEEVAQQLKVQCMREACEPDDGREEPQQRRGRGRGNARPYCRGTYFTDHQLYRMLRQAGEAQGVHPNDPRPVLLQSCLEAHLVTLWDVVAEMSPQQRKAKTGAECEAPIPDGVYYTKDELRRALPPGVLDALSHHTMCLATLYDRRVEPEPLI